MAITSVFGRNDEIKTLQQLHAGERSEFVAVYGRRRVGKTFLIKELFGDHYAFHVTGLFNGSLSKQLINFHAALNRFYPASTDTPVPSSWFEAFQILIKCLETNTKERKVIFIDELPWLDTPKSDFISAIEHFWNGWAFHRNDIVLIVCGSATSWMINELINNHGGLHNRVTTRIHLEPFTLKETEAFLQAKGAVYDRYQIVQLYMAMGGIPFYLEAIDVGLSVPQNIDQLFFSKNGLLRTEFTNLYHSLFNKEERHILIIEALSKKAQGLTRKDLVKATKLANGGTFTKILEELEQCGFIRKYYPFGKSLRGSFYQLTDPYSLFYLQFIKNSRAIGEGAWLTQIDQPKWRAWSGYAFEYICFYHLDAIKKQLGIGAVYTEVSSWRSRKSDPAIQIDLVLDRRDRVINLCEIKFSQGVFTITKSYANTLRNKVATFRQESKTKKAVFLTLITTFGLKQNQHATGVVQNELTMDVFFE